MATTPAQSYPIWRPALLRAAGRTGPPAPATGRQAGSGGRTNGRCTPHGVVLAWLRDVLEILKSHNIGWALWNFRGGFDILDSQRSDVEYEDWHGHKLDRKLLDLLIAS